MQIYIFISNFFIELKLKSLIYNPVKNYRRGIVDFFGVILPKRRRIAGEVSTLWARQGRGMGGDGRFWTIYTYVYLNMCIRTIYTYVTVINKGQ